MAKTVPSRARARCVMGSRAGPAPTGTGAQHAGWWSGSGHPGPTPARRAAADGGRGRAAPGHRVRPARRADHGAGRADRGLAGRDRRRRLLLLRWRRLPARLAAHRGRGPRRWTALAVASWSWGAAHAVGLATGGVGGASGAHPAPGEVAGLVFP